MMPQELYIDVATLHRRSSVPIYLSFSLDVGLDGWPRMQGRLGGWAAKVLIAIEG
jgi:hypothetical protein